MSLGIKNWHWRTKDVSPWAKTWFEEQLVDVECDKVKITSVDDVEGDCELGMRKSKLVTIYDQKISMTWTGTDSEGNQVSGTLTALEVAHDMDEGDYEFVSSVTTSSSPDSAKLHSVAKKQLADKLRPIFQQFPKAMMEAHGKDLLARAEEDAAASSAPGSGSSTPAASRPASTVPPSVASLSLDHQQPKESKTLNTSVVRAEGEYQCTSDDLFDFLTNEQKIPMWTRNPAKMKPEVGADVSLFGGNIAGKVTKVDKPKSFSCTWRAPTWPAGHYGTLDTTLNQGSTSTTLTLRLSGVPVGKEDETERNLNAYYINGLKQIGLVLLSSSTSSWSSARAPVLKGPRPKSLKPPPPSTWSLALTTAIPVTISVGLMAALIAGFWYGPSGPGSSAAGQ